MSGVRTSATPGRAVSHGRIDKREAILSAAFTVFADRGYARACMEEIAEVAGAAKHTVYNHLGDKETLFRHAMGAASAEVMAENLAVVERLLDDGDGDVRAKLENVAYRLLLRCCDDRSQAGHPERSRRRAADREPRGGRHVPAGLRRGPLTLPWKRSSPRCFSRR
ncbi:AcrR family transcriptional regulator [Streptosporangium album]|uniref:AcrR family transcriptional regulator n=1 Tax=Streptosporangium album TaxID=47479 RepID=A0A7W7W7E6_9ACTN|nr:TetR/AcrR family transcriptional regulator [Streptosporangium album]MBB4936763.1 AcrR family transcriptional regulator [Streptosporangium album]